MLTNLYVLIIIIPIVQISLCKINEPLRPQDRADAIRLLRLVKKGDVNNKQVRSMLQNEVKFFESIVETASTSTTRKSKPTASSKKRSNQKTDKSYREIKILLAKLLEQVMELEKEKRESKPITTQEIIVSSSTERLSLASSVASIKFVKKKKKDENSRKQRWGHWTDWSSCSVSCGKGRQIRWRHCIEHCDEAETEMEEKACQLPACGPGKLFGVIQLR